jgi:endonuclease-8
MPEGHTIHRYARHHRKHLAGEPVRAWSPQGRFADGAAEIDGRCLDTVDALGKHLFYRWDGGLTVHVHLGLFGRFRTYSAEVPAPTDGTRLALATGRATVYLAGPTACELISPAEEEVIRDRIGPDPLDPRSTPVRFKTALRRRTSPIGAALLDQKVVAGVGNVYRAELLFMEGMAPDRPARSLTEEEADALWQRIRTQLRRGERAGRIVTVDPAEMGADRDGDLRRSERLYVYHRSGEPCRRCGTEIDAVEMGGRNIWFCPTCQA